MTDKEMVELYRSYMDEREKCRLGGVDVQERLQDIDNKFGILLRCNNVTQIDVVQAAARHAKDVAEGFFTALFETPYDRTIFCLKCAPSTPVWSSGGNNSLWGMLKINSGDSIDDKPMEIFVMDDRVELSWGRNHLPSRNRDFGPAIVKIRADRTYMGYHVVNNATAKGHSRWRKKCAEHNLWMRLCK